MEVSTLNDVAEVNRPVDPYIPTESLTTSDSFNELHVKSACSSSKPAIPYFEIEPATIEFEHEEQREESVILQENVANEDESVVYGAPVLPTYDLSEDKEPYQLAFSREEFGDFFLKGAKWSRDGCYLLSCSDDRRMRVFSLPSQFYSGDFSLPIPEMRSTICVKEGGTVYDYSWYPLMDSSVADSCCFITTAQCAPIHLWNSVSGQLISTYTFVNHLDEIDTANSVAFTPDGSLIYAGFTKQIGVFDVNQPGRQIEEFKTHKKRGNGQIGIISCFDFIPADRIFAAGSYSKSIGVYDQRNNKANMILEGHAGGVTQIKFSLDGNLLYSGARKDNELLVWDMRSPGQVLAILNRDVQTNQRIYFDLDPSGRYVCSANHNGKVSIWDMTQINYESEEMEQPVKPILTFKGSVDCINSACWHPSLAMLTTTSGMRSYCTDSSQSEDSDQSDDDTVTRADNSIRLWWLGE